MKVSTVRITAAVAVMNLFVMKLLDGVGALEEDDGCGHLPVGSSMSNTDLLGEQRNGAMLLLDGLENIKTFLTIDISLLFQNWSGAVLRMGKFSESLAAMEIL